MPRVGLDGFPQLRVARVSGRDERVAAQVARILAREVQALVALAQLLVAGLEPLDERHVRLGVGGRSRVLAALLDPAVPRADVLADVAAVHLGSELAAVLLGNRARRLRPVREAARRVERARLVERSRGAGLDAERARAAVELERRGALELRVRDERPEHDPGSVTPRDQHRVLAVEADARADGAFAVDVVVLVDEHAVLAAEPAAERVELLAELRVRVEPRVARQPALAPAPGRAPARSSRARRRPLCRAFGSSVSGWQETSGRAIVNLISAKSPRSLRSAMWRSVAS